MLVVCESGQMAMLSALLSTLSGLYCRLFTNDVVPSETDDETVYEEPDYPDYAPQPLDSWEPVRQTDSGSARTKHAVVTFDSGAFLETVPIYGFFVTDNAGRLWWGSRIDDPPYILGEGGEPFTCVPQLVLRAIRTP